MIATKRLLLRRWRESDRFDFHRLNCDPSVMATIGPVMDRVDSDGYMDRIERRFDEHGYGLWCMDLNGEAIGFTGFMKPWFRDGVEIGWRVKSEHWGRGYASEAAESCLAQGFGELGFDEIISFTAATNTRSRRVMEKLGLVRDPDGDFEHPSLPAGNPLQLHVLYRLTAEQYRAQL